MWKLQGQGVRDLTFLPHSSRNRFRKQEHFHTFSEMLSKCSRWSKGNTVIVPLTFPTLNHPPLLATSTPRQMYAAGVTLLRICHDSGKGELLASDLVHPPVKMPSLLTICRAVHPKLVGLLHLHTKERALRGNYPADPSI